MVNTLHQKPFLDYTSQINILKNKKLMINDESYAAYILSKISYYSLINGYKDSFKDHYTHNFFPDTDFQDIYNLYLLDVELRGIFLKYILILEKNVKSSISYHFSQLYGNGIAFYQNSVNYDYGTHISDVQYLFKKMNQKIKGKNPSPQVSHYMKIYNDVPLWVLTTDLTIGEISAMFRYLKGHCKTLVCNDFHNIGRAELGKMLIMLTKFRNICAHGNRLFNTHTGDHIMDCVVHQKLHIKKTGTLYNYGKSDLFAAIICLKYLLDHDDFRSFYMELKKTLKIYQPSESILQTMGFPDNWMSILRIKAY
ncbi:MAG: Abi family protein [bacterium]|nr:Abi family protein [bacterium]